MHRSTFRLLVLAATGLFVTATTANAQEPLRWKFKPGESRIYQMVQTMDMAMSVMGRDIDTKMNQTMDMAWTVADVADDGTATLKQQISRVRMTMNGPFPIGNVEYDSDSGEEPEGIGQQFSKIFGAMVGKEFTMKMSPRGEVSEVSVPQALEDVISEAGAGFPGGGFDKESIKQMVSQGAQNLAFPDGAVSEGQTWGGKSEVKMPFGTMQMDNQFKYLGTESRNGRTLHKIALNPKLTMKADPNQQFKLTVKSQEAEGIIYFDNQAGAIAESNMKQTMEMELSAGGQVIQQTIEQNMTMKRMDGESKP